MFDIWGLLDGERLHKGYSYSGKQAYSERKGIAFRNGWMMKTIHPLVVDQHYVNLKNQVIKGERRVLKELGFCVHVKHPHKIIVMYLEALNLTGKRKLVQCAWNFMNDSLRSNVFMQFHPESIACACIYLAARQCLVPLPNNPSWFLIFDVDEDEIQQICLIILRLYARPKPNLESLEKTVEELKRKQQAAKSKARGIVSDVDTPNSSSRQNSPKVFSPNPTSLLQSMKKEKDKVEGRGPKGDNGDMGSDKSDRDSERPAAGKKRSHDRSDDSDRSVDSKSGSSRSHSSGGSRRSRSPRSDSPASKKRRRSPAAKKIRKQESLSRDKHKKKYRSRSRSFSRSPIRSSKPSKKSRRDDYSRDIYKEKDYYREKDYKDRDYYREKERDYYKDRDMKDRDYHKDRRSYTPEKDRHRSRKHRSNGHRDSPVREKLDKHRR